MKVSTKLVSVVIITRDRPLLLDRAIKSIASQKCKSLEIVVVDNLSTTSPDLKNVLALDVVINVTRTSTFLSAAAARNYGATLAKGDYICFLDDDDYYLGMNVEHLLQVFETDSRVDVAYGNTKMLGPEGVDLGLSSGPAEIVPLMMYRYIHLNSIMVKKNVFSHERFDEAMTTYEDVDLMFRLVKSYKCVHIDTDLAVWNRDNRPDQLTQKNWARSYKNWLILCEKFSDVIDSSRALVSLYYKKMFLLALINFKPLSTFIYLFKYVVYGKLAFFKRK